MSLKFCLLTIRHDAAFTMVNKGQMCAALTSRGVSNSSISLDFIYDAVGSLLL